MMNKIIPYNRFITYQLYGKWQNDVVITSRFSYNSYSNLIHVLQRNKFFINNNKVIFFTISKNKY